MEYTLHPAVDITLDLDHSYFLQKELGDMAVIHFMMWL